MRIPYFSPHTPWVLGNLVCSQLLSCPSAGITNQMSIDELSPCEEEAPPSPAEDEHNQNGNLD